MTMTAAAPHTHIPETIQVDAAHVGRMLTLGGHAELTVRSKETGHHVTMTFSCKKRGPNGRLLSRATRDGRVGINDADIVFIDRDRELQASFVPATGQLRTTAASTPVTRWTAAHVLAWINGDPKLGEQAEVFAATRCARCSRKLTDPESVERGLGPECYGTRTGSKAAH